jgi:branched-chain amino acid transport system ATP-binding protein
LLDVKNIDVFYGAVNTLSDVSLRVSVREIVSIIGSNGAGKTTLLRAISGLIHPKRGTIILFGNDITYSLAEEIARLGIAHVPEGGSIFGPISVEENLTLGAYIRYQRKDNRKEIDQIKDFVYSMFPILSDRKNQRANTLSGGEQQMLAIGRGLMSVPKLMLLDEPSMGLAPILVKTIFRSLKRLIEEPGITILLVEQNARIAVKVASRTYILSQGKIVKTGNSQELVKDEEIKRTYLGLKTV